MYNIPAKIGVILVVVSLFFWGCGTWMAVKGVEVHDGTLPANATIVELTKIEKFGEVRYRPVVLFADSSGRERQAELDEYVHAGTYEVGQQLPIKYDRLNSSRAQLDTGDKAWVFYVVIFGLAASLTIAGVLLITVITRAMNRRREARGQASAY